MTTRSNTRAQVNEGTSTGSSAEFKLVPFWPERPELWFLRAEQKLALRNITDDQSKYDHVMDCLSWQQMDEVMDIIRRPPESGRYEALKEAILRRLTESQPRKLQRPLEREDIGDRKPSQFLRYIRTQAGEAVSDDFLKTLWAGRLPPLTRAVLAASNAPLDQLAVIADTIEENVQRTSTKSEGNEDKILRKIDEITVQMAEVYRRIDRRPPRQIARARSKSRTRQRSKSPAARNYCWYHWRFGKRSTKCRARSWVPGNGEAQH
ncbi:hypothetical protein WN51_14554 [Melipona quadrifasciata]|uniref:DUF7041 domain-containing protein n=1 Tax=Melipona quadrifasciata TaxID=166423 RepID=A0A0M8ZXQ3_9HYME|nr:hypothetical protein WN51_14554 [Melipona quadrifasciata]